MSPREVPAVSLRRANPAYRLHAWAWRLGSERGPIGSTPRRARGVGAMHAGTKRQSAAACPTERTHTPCMSRGRAVAAFKRDDGGRHGGLLHRFLSVTSVRRGRS
eukprot:350974-Chlamydomonas_euryale.AAC.3